MTKTARNSTLGLGFTMAGMVAVISSMEPTQFYKSMTSNCAHELWQDVYHVPFAGLVLYVKFAAGVVVGFTLLSFKEM